MRTKTNDIAKTSRRDFLKLSGAAATTSILASNIDIVRGAHAAGSDTIKIGLVGCGGRGTGAVMQALSTNAPTKLWALGDVFADKVERSYSGLLKGVNTAGWYNQDAKKNGDKDFTDKIDVPPERRFVGFEAYKKVIDSGVDVVFLVSRPHFYPIHFEYAIEKDKHVFVEKPLATDAPGCDA